MMILDNFKKKCRIPLAVLLIMGLFTLFLIPACDDGTNGDPVDPGTQTTPFNPIEPDTAWVDGPVTIDIYTFNDFHGAMDSSASTADPGAARFAAITKHLMGQGSEHSMLLAAGDNYQGSALSNYFVGKPVSLMMKELGVKYSVIGNHEWDWGDDKFAVFAEDGDITFITANIFYTGTNNRPDFCHPYVIANRAGRKIGIVGLTLVGTPAVVSASAIEGYEFRSPGQWLTDMIDDLRTEQGCDAVIALTHMASYGSTTSATSGEAVNLANAGYDFDAIISAHSHQTVNGVANGIRVIQANYNGRALGKISLNFNDHDLVSVDGEIFSGFTGGSILPVGEVDQTVAAMVDEYEALVAPIMNEVVGKFGNAQSIGRNAWANKLVFDYIVRMAGEATWRAGPGWQDVVLIQNSGGWRTIDLGGPEDDVTVRIMWTLMPFDNEIYLFELRGDYLMNLLSGRPASGSGTLGSSAVITNASGSGTTWTISSSGEVIDPTKLYKVSMNDFMFSGGDNFNVEDIAVYDDGTLNLGVPLRDGMIAQLRHRLRYGEIELVSQTIGTLTGGPLVHEYEIKAANTRYVEDTALIHLINDAMLYYTKQHNTTLAGTAPLSATANAQQGTLTRDHMSGIYTYDNTLDVVSMTGANFKEWMEWAHWEYHRTNMRMGDLTVPYGGGTGYNFDQFKGLNYEVDLTKDRGSRIVNMKNPDGTDFDLTKTYNVAVNNYRLDTQFPGTTIFTTTGSFTTVERNVDANLTVDGETVTNGNGMKGVLADYIERAMGGEITNQFTPSWRFIMPGEEEDWYPAYRAKAVELLNNGTLTFSASRATTITEVRDYVTTGPQPPAEYFPAAQEPKAGPIFVDFEDALWAGIGYADNARIVEGFEWTINGYSTMDGNDRRDGTRSVRLRGNNTDTTNGNSANRVELMDYLTNGIGTISFDYGSYSSHSGGVLVVYYQVRGGTGWVEVGRLTAPAWGGSMEKASFTVNQAANTRFKIEKVTATGTTHSVNVDNISVTVGQ